MIFLTESGTVVTEITECNMQDMESTYCLEACCPICDNGVTKVRVSFYYLIRQYFRVVMDKRKTIRTMRRNTEVEK
jgi:hypothetical protein